MTETLDWNSFDLSQYLSEGIITSVALVFVAKSGRIKGIVRGRGLADHHSFDTSVNDASPLNIPVKIPVIEYRITEAIPDTSSLEIQLVGYQEST